MNESDLDTDTFVSRHGPLLMLLHQINIKGHTITACLVSGGSDGKVSVYNAGDLGSSPGLGRSPGEGNGNPLQHSCLENPMDRGTWWAKVHGVAESQTGLERLIRH